MDLAVPSPTPESQPTLAEVLQTPDLLGTANVDLLLAGIPPELPEGTLALVEKASVGLLKRSDYVRVERLMAARFDYGLVPTKLEVRQAPDLSDKTFSDSSPFGEEQIVTEFSEFEITLASGALGKTIPEMAQTNHAICYRLGRVMAAVMARDQKAWPAFIEWNKSAATAEFVSLEAESGQPVVTYSLGAFLPLFLGFSHELPEQLKKFPAHAPKFLDGLTVLAKLEERQRTFPKLIASDAQSALREIAALDPSLFDSAMSALLDAPNRRGLLDGADSARRKIELIQGMIEGRFTLPIGAYKWEEMPISRGPVIGAVAEMYRELRADLHKLALKDEGEEFAEVAELDPRAALGGMYEMFKMHEILDRIHGFRCIGMPAADLIDDMLPLLRDENALSDSSEYQEAAVCEQEDIAIAQFEALQIDPIHSIDREFLTPLLRTLLERGEKISNPELLDQLERQARLRGEFSEPALKLLALTNPERAKAVNTQYVSEALGYDKPNSLPDLLERCDRLNRMTACDAPQKLLAACLPIAARLDPLYKEMDPSNNLVNVDPALRRPSIWAKRLDIDESTALENLLKAAIMGADEGASQRTVPAKRMLIQASALKTVTHAAKLLPEPEFRALVREVWPRLNDELRERFLHAMTGWGVDETWRPTMRGHVMREEFGSAENSPQIASHFAKLKSAQATWSVNQYYR